MRNEPSAYDTPGVPGPDGPVHVCRPAVTGGKRQATLRWRVASLTAVARPCGGAAGEGVR
jgi:hypothetical protein